MSNLINIIILIVGFILLIKGADIFVDGSSNIAKKIGIPSVIVGLTIVSLGTSAPELAISAISAMKGNNEIAIGNVLGSNIFNTLVVLGGTAAITPLIIKKNIVKRDFLVNIVVLFILYIFSFGIRFDGKDGILSRIDGLILLLLCIIYIVILIRSVFKNKNLNIDDIGSKNLSNIKLSKNIIKIIIGVVGIILGGEFVVNSATKIAYSFGMSEKLVGLTIIAMGTSLPELVTSIVAALKGETEIALGNVLGSNIFNILLILGLSSTINPIVVAGNLHIDLLFLVIVTLIIGIMIFANKDKEINKLSRFKGIILVLLYIIYLLYIIMRN